MPDYIGKDDETGLQFLERINSDDEWKMEKDRRKFFEEFWERTELGAWW